ncbi:MAG: glycosyltransferase family 39 protein, partial [Gemmatimonadales bacterium]
SDLALHACSMAWALATIPLIWLLGCRLGGPREALIACILFALAPVSLYYSVEARMYSQLWFVSALTAWVALRLHDRGDAAALALWTLASAGGLLTHYFYAFVWAACMLWLALRPGRCSGIQLAVAAVVPLVIIAPWYRLVPESLARWRVTGHWLDGRPPADKLLAAPFTLGWSLLSSRGVWGGSKAVDNLGALLVLALGAVLLRRGRAALIGNGRDLVWLWAIATCAGPVVFDLLRGASTSLVSRYALAGVPAAMLLAALAIGTLPAGFSLGAVALLVGTWLPALRDVFALRARAWEPYRLAAARVAAWAAPDDLVIVHSIPSGVLGIARYLEADVPVAAWVGQLGTRRMPDDLAALLAGRHRVALIRIHEVGEPAPEEAWLRANATVLRDERRDAATIVYFALSPTRR